MIRIVTDTHASLSPDVADEMGITLIPSTIAFGKERFTEGTGLAEGEFYERLAASKDFPVMHPPTVEELVALYDRLLKVHPHTTILSIHASGEVSELAANARQAAERFLTGQVRVFDTRTISVAEGLMVRQAVLMAQNKAPVAEVIDALEDMRDKARIFLALDTVEFMVKGGPLGRATYLDATVSTKPVLTLHEGVVTGYARFISREAAIKNLKGLVYHVAQGRSGVQLGVTHSRCLPDAEKLAAELGAEVRPEVTLVGEISPAVGAHCGPGAIGVAWYVPD